MINANLLPVSLDLGIDFCYLNGQIDLYLFFPDVSFTILICFPDYFLKN